MSDIVAFAAIRLTGSDGKVTTTCNYTGTEPGIKGSWSIWTVPPPIGARNIQEQVQYSSPKVYSGSGAKLAIVTEAKQAPDIEVTLPDGTKEMQPYWPDWAMIILDEELLRLTSPRGSSGSRSANRSDRYKDRERVDTTAPTTTRQAPSAPGAKKSDELSPEAKEALAGVRARKAAAAAAKGGDGKPAKSADDKGEHGGAKAKTEPVTAPVK